MANLRVKKKHLDVNSVDGTKIKLSANEALRGVDKDSAEVELLKLDGDNKLIGYGYELARKVDLDAEETARVAADSTLQAAIEDEETARVAADSTLQAAIEDEVSAREAADSTLQAAINAEKTARIAADLVEKTERMAADDAEESARIAADSTLQAAIEDEVFAREAADLAVKTELRGGASSSYDTLKKIEDKIEFIVSNVDPDALDSLTEIVDAFQAADGTLNQAISNLSSAATSGLANEKTERMAADSTLQAAIEDEVSAREAADSTLQAAIEDEETARVAADLVEKTERMAADSTLQAAIEDEVSAREDADSSLQAAIIAEASSRQAAIANLVDSAPEVLDTLNELAAALGDDANFATTIANRLSDIEGSLSTSASNLEDYADNKVQELKDLITDTLLRKESFVLTAQQVANGYVVLSGTSVIDNSVSAFKDRLSVFEGEDFTVSVVGGETRLTFINSYASGGEEAVEVGDELRVAYWSFAE